MTHTPTPWKNCENAIYGADRTPICDTMRVLNVDNNDSPYEANAEFIVRAVNSHEELVEALKIVLANASMPTDIRENTKQVLAKAEGK